MNRLLSLLLILIAAAPSWAAPRVSLLTFFPGSEVYQLEGHTALRVQGDSIGDFALNWGTFDFAAPNFIYRFVKGETDYSVEAVPATLFINYYGDSGRKVVEQELNLSEAETQRLIARVAENLKPENRVYRYNYVYDNCATRPLAHIEASLDDGPLTLGDEPMPELHSFREVMAYYHGNYPWYQFGIDTALGSGIDAPIGVREKTFAPVMLMEILAGTRKADGSPLVSRTTVLREGNSANGGTSVLGPTPWLLTPSALAWAILALTVVISLYDYRRSCRSRWFDSLLFALLGLEGLVLTFLIFISVHEATSPNWLYLWLNPLALVVAIGVWFKSWKKVVVSTKLIIFVLTFALIVLCVCGLQRLNSAVYPMMYATMLRCLTIIPLRSQR